MSLSFWHLLIEQRITSRKLFQLIKMKWFWFENRNELKFRVFETVLINRKRWWNTFRYKYCQSIKTRRLNIYCKSVYRMTGIWCNNLVCPAFVRRLRAAVGTWGDHIPNEEHKMKLWNVTSELSAIWIKPEFEQIK